MRLGRPVEEDKKTERPRAPKPKSTRLGIRPAGVLASIIAGFGLSVVFYLMPNTPGDVLERLAPFGVSLLIALAMRQRPGEVQA